jgi:hypothetical protein
MEPIILDNIALKFDRKKLREKLRIKEDSTYVERFENLIDEAEEIANIKAVYKIAYIEEKGDNFVIIDGIKFKSKVLRVNLDKVNRVFAFVATSGKELEDWSEKKTDMLEMFWADAIKEEALRISMAALNEHIENQYQPGKTAEMNPGSLGDWPISEQKGLFSLIGDTEKLIGVKLKSSFLMSPIKSVSGIIFSSDTDYKNCQLCPREKCPGRKAPFDKKLLENKYGGL